MRFLICAALFAASVSACGGREDAGSTEQPTSPEVALAGGAPSPGPTLAVKPAPSDGPFGLSQGMTVAQISELTGKAPLENDGSFYVLATVPKPHPAFEGYFATVSPKLGLCKIVGYVSVESNRFGHQVKNQVDALKTPLTEKYGPPDRSIDSVLRGSLWDEPEDFMMGLIQKDRTLLYVWSSSERDSPLPNDLAAIGLRAVASRSDTADVSLGYEFSNFGDCVAESEAQSNDSL